MGFLKRLFGGETEKKPVDAGPQVPAPNAAAQEPPAATSSKTLIRSLGSADRAVRRDATVLLAEMNDRSAMRPLMNAYLNFGDPEALAALRGYGTNLTPAVMRDAMDTSVVGERRARMLDMLAATGDEECVAAVRTSVDDRDPAIHVQACSALVLLRDLGGVDLLERDLHRTDVGFRTLALKALRELDVPQARHAVAQHVERYLAESGAIPEGIAVHAPRLINRETSLTSFVCDLIKASPHQLTVVTGSEAIGMATSRRDAVLASLKGFDVHLTTRRMAPEEQLAALEAARDAAAAGTNAVVLGALAGPDDSPPLPHFLTRPAGSEYTARIMIVDPHEVRWVMDWWHYVVDQSEVPTDFDVVVAASTPGASAISEEEYQLFEIVGRDNLDQFTRAFLAHI